ncbi:MAG TPA: hypothetical protein VKE98_11450 [Gemmataceae bacterium]|nr:hypothetical protein [Gemmataceae bacterium]
MKRRPIIICFVVAILGSVIFWLQSNYIITGWLNGEAFYQGRPTSYWRQELGSISVFHFPSSFHPKKVFFRPGWLDSLMGSRTYTIVDLDLLEDHPLWIGDPNARDVLTELTVGSTDTIKEFAEDALARIKQ